MGAERLNARGWARMMAGLAAGDPDGETSACYLSKELLREVYSADGLDDARDRLAAFYRWCADAEVFELTRLARTIRA